MGISGLETFVDSLYLESPNNGAFRQKALKEIKLVIDGNQLPHVICNELSANNEFGGNYDQLYQVAKKLLDKLKPFIRIIIFDGSKEDTFKIMQRFNQRIEKIANLKTKINQFPTQANHLQTLKQCLPKFTLMILYKVIKELQIEYTIADGVADHAIACYAKGENPTGQKYTVLSRDSYFYVYNLDKGYLCFKYFISFLRDLDNLNEETKVPIFDLNNLLEYLRLKSYKSWLYFCVILGDMSCNLERNIDFLKANKINTRNANFKTLVDYLRKNEINSQLDIILIIRLRSFYSSNDLQKIDNMIQNFQFENREYFLSDLTSPDDFDRFILSLKNLNINYIPCHVEDISEYSVFNVSRNILKNIYNCLDCEKITEYSRGIITTIVRYNEYIFNKASFQACDSTLNYLDELNNTINEDNLTLFYAALSEWYKCLRKDEHKNKLAINPNELINSVLLNWIIISLISKPKTATKRSFILLRDLFKTGQNYTEIISIYDLIINEYSNNYSKYFNQDLKLVHRLNEFQAAYYLLNVYCKLKKYKFEFYSPDEFLNGLFVCRFVLENHIVGSESYRIKILLGGNKSIQDKLVEIKRDLNTFLNCAGENELVDLMMSTSIN